MLNFIFRIGDIFWYLNTVKSWKVDISENNHVYIFFTILSLSQIHLVEISFALVSKFPSNWFIIYYTICGWEYFVLFSLQDHFLQQTFVVHAKKWKKFIQFSFTFKIVGKIRFILSNPKSVEKKYRNFFCFVIGTKKRWLSGLRVCVRSPP